MLRTSWNPEYIRRCAEKMVENERNGRIWMANNLNKIPEEYLKTPEPVKATAPESAKKPRKPRKKKEAPVSHSIVNIIEGGTVVSFS